MNAGTRGPVLVELHHPGHVHIFARLAREGLAGRRVVLLAKDRPDVLKLLGEMKLAHRRYRDLRRGKSLLWTVLDLLYSWWRNLGAILAEKPDTVLSVAGVYCGLPAFLCGCRLIVLTDTETAALSHRLAYPFALRVLFPDSYDRDLDRAFGWARGKAIFYSGTQECAYLLGAAIDGTALRAKHGLAGPLFFLRLSAGQAFHESIGRQSATVRRIVELLARRGRVVISSELPLPAEFAAYAYPFARGEYHAALAAADLVITEGATTATESAILGTPYIFINRNRYGTIRKSLDAGLGEAVDSFEQCLAHLERGAGALEWKRDRAARFAEFRRGLESPLDRLAALLADPRSGA